MRKRTYTPEQKALWKARVRERYATSPELRVEKRARNLAWEAANPGRMKELTAKWHVEHAEHVHAKQRAYRVAHPEIAKRATAKFLAARPGYYNALTRTRREKLAGRPRSAACEICGAQSTKSLHFDHDHRTGEFRGWLCWNCNTVLGKVNDDTELLDKMIVYLSRSRRPRLVVGKAL